MNIYISFLILFPLLTFAQPSPEGYVETRTYGVNLVGNYPDFHQELILSDFIYADDSSGNQSSGSISINNNILSANFNKTWGQQAMKLGVIKHLNVYPILPNIELGPILSTGGGAQTGYSARIENNDLVIYSIYFVESLNTPAPVTISPYSPNNEFPFLGVNGSGNIIISQNKLSFDYYIDSWAFDPNPIGIIYEFPEYAYDGSFGYSVNIYNTDLGILQSNSRNTIYKAKIENNQLIIYSTEPLPQIPSGCFLNFGYDLTTQEPSKWYRDNDNDGFGSPHNTSTGTATPPIGYVANNADCDDANVRINPDTIWYIDQDLDGYGATIGTTITSCTKPLGYVIKSGDCNDADATLNPNTIWYRDADGDGFGTSTTTLASCTQPAGYVRNTSDYNDSTVNITNIPPQTFYRDADNDTFGTSLDTKYYSVKPTRYVTNSADCNDSDATLNPNTRWYADNDLDGLGDPSNYITQCATPSGNYVRNNSDNCPLVSGTSADCNSQSSGGSQDQNYIITTNYNKPTLTRFVSPTPDKAQVNITYFDGLGRPIQQIANQQSDSGKDIITHIEYDTFGRQVEEYLPFKSSNTDMAFDPSAKANVLSFYANPNPAINGNPALEATTNPFSKKEFEASPLNRVLKQAAPGNDWAMANNHTIKLDYQTNSAGEVKNFGVSLVFANNTYNPTLTLSTVNNGFYNANELYKTITYDENTTATPSETAGSTVEFKNKEGQVVLKRTYDANQAHDTYYVYDNYGNLTYVLPPLVESNTTTLSVINTRLNDLCYQYKYDNRNRLVEKKLPAKQWEFIVYDKLDRPVATGPASSPFSDLTTVGWLITKYDAFSRPVYTGWMTTTAATSLGRISLQTAQNNATSLYESKQTSGTIDGVAAYYSNVIAPMAFKLLTVNYYDNYTFPNAPAIPTTVETQTVLTTAQVKSLPTGSWTRVLTSNSSLLGETATTFYDSKARPIRSYNKNYLGGYTYTDSNLDFTGKPDSTKTYHKRLISDPELKTTEVFVYSAQGRLLTQTHQIGTGTVELMASNSYDELGQLISKKVGNTAAAPVQKVDYTYNIRGWLKGINDINSLTKTGDPKDLFAFKMSYNVLTAGISGVNALYNGNIAETQWATNSDNGILRNYGYKYDNLNRLKEGIYKKGSVLNMYNESLTYDKNGNIKTLSRFGNSDTTLTQIDNLTYIYGTGNTNNQLLQVNDSSNKAVGFIDATNSGDDYTYDANGNMTADANKNITAIVYNHLNLPAKTTFASAGNITYIYTAVGQKLQKIVTQGTNITTTDYLGGYQYKITNTGTVALQFFTTAEGYVEPAGSSYKYVYQYKDHLGNVRLSYDKSLVIQEENNYYTFGLKQEGYNVVKNSTNAGLKYKFQGQERQGELGLNWDSFKWRNYDMAIGRFMSVDPLAEKYEDYTPYQFSSNQPVHAKELEGLESSNDLNKNIIINTVNIQSNKRQNVRSGVPMIEMGIGYEISRSKSAGNNNTGANGTLTAVSAKIGMSVGFGEEKLTAGITVGQATGDAKLAGRKVAGGDITAVDANASYNLKTGSKELDIQVMKGSLSSGGEQKTVFDDIKVSINAAGAYINVNLTEMGNAVKDFGNLTLSYLKGTAQNYFQEGGSENANPITK